MDQTDSTAGAANVVKFVRYPGACVSMQAVLPPPVGVRILLNRQRDVPVGVRLPLRQHAAAGRRARTARSRPVHAHRHLRADHATARLKVVYPPLIRQVRRLGVRPLDVPRACPVRAIPALRGAGAGEIVVERSEGARAPVVVACARPLAVRRLAREVAPPERVAPLRRAAAARVTARVLLQTTFAAGRRVRHAQVPREAAARQAARALAPRREARAQRRDWRGVVGGHGMVDGALGPACRVAVASAEAALVWSAEEWVPRARRRLGAAVRLGTRSAGARCVGQPAGG